MSTTQEKDPSRASAGRAVQHKSVAPAVHYPFWFGGSASGMAACVTHPLDLVKVRLQTRTGDAPRNMSGTFVHILRRDGPLGLYNGLSAALLRQLTYSTARFGIYEEMKSAWYTTRDPETGAVTGTTTPSFGMLVAMASGSGFAGGVAGNFADVLNVRMQHDAALPPDQRRNYRHALDGMVRMARDEGPASWFRGWLPNSGRAAVMTASQLASYDVFKRLLLQYTPLGDDLTTHFSASFLAGLVAATVTSPVDVVKTRVMSSSHDHGIVRVVADIYRAEGAGWMFKGWVPSFLRLGPHTICTFVFLEMHRKTYRKLKGVQDQPL